MCVCVGVVGTSVCASASCRLRSSSFLRFIFAKCAASEFCSTQQEVTAKRAEGTKGGVSLGCVLPLSAVAAVGVRLSPRLTGRRVNVIAQQSADGNGSLACCAQAAEDECVGLGSERT